MRKKFKVNRTKIKGGCQSETKVSQLISNSRMPLGILLEHMHKKFEINLTKIKGGCQSVRKVVTHNSKSDLPLGTYIRKTGKMCQLVSKCVSD